MKGPLISRTVTSISLAIIVYHPKTCVGPGTLRRVYTILLTAELLIISFVFWSEVSFIHPWFYSPLRTLDASHGRFLNLFRYFVELLPVAKAQDNITHKDEGKQHALSATRTHDLSV
jgi:hypothetical protein